MVNVVSSSFKSSVDNTIVDANLFQEQMLFVKCAAHSCEKMGIFVRIPHKAKLKSLHFVCFFRLWRLWLMQTCIPIEFILRIKSLHFLVRILCDDVSSIFVECTPPMLLMVLNQYYLYLRSLRPCNFGEKNFSKMRFGGWILRCFHYARSLLGGSPWEVLPKSPALSTLYNRMADVR